MGPPKRRPKRLKYSEIKRRYDTFEYRWDYQSGSYYLYNAFTGETIFSTSLEVMNRQRSMWSKPEKYPSDMTQTIRLLPEGYLSRTWGRRKFYGFTDEIAAANHIVTVARGFLARLRLRQYYRSRYYTKVDSFSGYLFYVDSERPFDETVWYKPRLAFPDDILPFVEEDPDDYMNGFKFSKLDFQKGPFLRVAGLNKQDQDRAELDVFVVKNELRDIACKRYADIDLNSVSVNDVVVWMAGSKVSELVLNEYNYMRAVAEGDDWHRIIQAMRQYPDNVMIQLFGYHSFSKGEVPMESELRIAEIAREVMDMCIEIITDEQQIYTETLKYFVMQAFHNIVSIRPGRTEYLDTDQVVEQGEFRQLAVDAFLKKKVTMFNKYLQHIPNETIYVFEKHSEIPTTVVKPLPKSVEIIEISLKCLGCLAQEIEAREVMSVYITEPVLFVIEICQEYAYVIQSALRLLYNLCYRCESGQEAILISISNSTFGTVAKFLAAIYYNHSGDRDVMRQYRRVELALAKDGWRGQVEAQISEEMKEELRLHNEEHFHSQFDSKGGDEYDQLDYKSAAINDNPSRQGNHLVNSRAESKLSDNKAHIRERDSKQSVIYDSKSNR